MTYVAKVNETQAIEKEWPENREFNLAQWVKKEVDVLETN